MVQNSLEHHYNRLYPFQKEGVRFLSEARTALLADDVGVGKTAQALVAAQFIGARKILVICTASIKYDWKSRAVSWGFMPHEVFVVGSREPWPEDTGGRIMLIVNYDLAYRREVARILVRSQYDLLICDESHYLKSHTAKRTKAVFGAGGYLSRSSRCWLLTGTPVLNRPEELYTTLRALCIERIEPYSDYITFTQRYCGGKDGTWGWDARGATNQEELSAKLVGFMLRRERDILTDLPEKIMRVVHIEKSEEIERLLFQESEEETPQALSIRQKIGLAKVPESVRYIKERLETEEKIVVFAYHKSVISALKVGLGAYYPEHITGDVSSSSKRMEALHAFMESERCRVIILQIDAAGTGIDGMQFVAKRGVFVEISHVPGVNQQAMGRVHRNGQKVKTVFDFLVVEDSLDECVLDRNIFKSGVVKKLMGDENQIFDFKTEKEHSMDAEGYSPAVKVEMVIEVGNAQIGQHVCRILQSQEGVRICSANLMTPIFPTTPSILEEIDSQQKQLAGEQPVKRTRRKVKDEQPKADPIPMVAPQVIEAPPVPQPVNPNPFTQVAPPTPVPPAPQVQLTTEQYKEWVLQAVKKIQTVVAQKDPAQVNVVLGQLSDRFKATFPQYQTAFDVSSLPDQLNVVQMINLFLAEKKISG